jgi:UDPglucose 6-dehydrogenase
MNRQSHIRSVGVVGLGTVGGALVEALSLAGRPVIGYDPYLEVGAPELLSGCSPVFVCVPTPTGEDGELDTSAVWKAVRDVEADLEPGTIVAIKSTVPPGTVEALSLDFPLLVFACVPEFLVAARPLETLTGPDRILVGAETPVAFEVISDVMTMVAPGAPILWLRPIEAELAKLASNAMLAAKVAIANELALVCEGFDVAWTDVQAAVGLDRRIGQDHITVSPSRGFGGGCLPKDLDGLIAAARSKGYGVPLLSAIRDFNVLVRRQPPAAGR